MKPKYCIDHWGRRAFPIALFGFGAVLWYLFVLHTHFKLEDAFITFRYSANLVNGDGFVFNPGERVLGTTTPLQTVILALFALPFGPESIPSVASAIMPLFGLLAGLVAYYVLVSRNIPPSAAALGVLFIYAHVAIIRTGIGGMETPLVLLLMALSLWALVRGKPMAVAAFSALLILCRVDGFIWVGLLFVSGLFQFERRIVLKQIAVFAAILLPWIVFATLYYGTPIPNSVLAKGVVRPDMENILLDPERLTRYAIWFAQGTGMKWNPWIMPFWLALLGLGARRLLRDSPTQLGLLVAFPPLYALTMYFGRSPRFEWYLVPITFCTLLLAGVGVYELYRAASRLVPVRISRATPYIGLALVLIVTGQVYCRNSVPVMLRHLRMAQENEDGLRRDVGLWLRANTPANATVAMEAIGYQGFYSQRHIIDMAGLVTPESVNYKRLTRRNGQIFDWILRDFKPDYIVLRSFEVDTNRHFNGGPLFLTPWKEQQFHATYTEVGRFVAPYPKSAPLVRHLTIYERRVE